MSFKDGEDCSVAPAKTHNLLRLSREKAQEPAARILNRNGTFRRSPQLQLNSAKPGEQELTVARVLTVLEPMTAGHSGLSEQAD